MTSRFSRKRSPLLDNEDEGVSRNVDLLTSPNNYYLLVISVNRASSKYCVVQIVSVIVSRGSGNPNYCLNFVKVVFEVDQDISPTNQLQKKLDLQPSISTFFA